MGEPETTFADPRTVRAAQPDSRERDSGANRFASLAGRRVLVMGLGRFGGGVGVTRWLAAQGAVVTVTDQALASTLTESIEGIRDLNVAMHFGRHDEADLNSADLVIVNPAVVKLRSPFFREVVRRRISWTTEMNLFCERCPAPVIGVTGTYGKSTTCAMLADVLRASLPHGTWNREHGTGKGDGRPEGRSERRSPVPEPAKESRLLAYDALGLPAAGLARVHLGGNIGNSLLMELPGISSNDVVVLEMSNAQLEDLPQIGWAPHVAVITNLWPHHLDRYESFAEYMAAKLNIIRPENVRPRADQAIVVGDVHPEVEAMLQQRLAAAGRDSRPPASPSFVVRVAQPAEAFSLRVPGKHNQQNAACVLAVCQVLGIDERSVRSVLTPFPGLPHRIQFIRSIDGVDYFNDSKSTSPSATVVALESFDRPTVAIVGGQKKDVALSTFAAALVRSCRAVVCTGESGQNFAEAVRTEALAANGLRSPRTIVHRADRLEDALRLARHECKAGDVVLFSPGAPSFDRYTNFTQRGDQFVALVEAL